MTYPSIDHYYGRTVEAIEDIENGWQVRLEGGILIVNLDETYDKPGDELVGMGFMSSTLSAEQTVLYFGTRDNPHAIKMVLTPTKYGINDPRVGQGEMKIPQDADQARAAEVEKSRPADPSPERVAEGPETHSAAKPSKPRRASKKGTR